MNLRQVIVSSGGEESLQVTEFNSAAFSFLQVMSYCSDAQTSSKYPSGELSRSGYPWLDCESDSTYRLTSQSTVSIFVNMSATNIKEEAKRLLEKLPDNLTWDDLMHEIYVRQSIEAGLADSETGKVVEVSDVRRRFGLPS